MYEYVNRHKGVKSCLLMQHIWDINIMKGGSMGKDRWHLGGYRQLLIQIVFFGCEMCVQFLYLSCFMA